MSLAREQISRYMPVNPPEPIHSRLSGSIERQLKIYKILALFLLAVLAIGGAFAWYFISVNQPVDVVIDKTSVAVVRNAKTANDLLQQAEASKCPGGDFPTNSYVRLQQVHIIHLSNSAEVDTDDTALQHIAAALKIHIRAYVLVVSGHASIGLPTLSAANDTVAVVKDHYANLSSQGDLIGDPVVLTPVTIVRMAVAPELLRASSEEAAPYFWTPPLAHYYTVRSGDRGMEIAHRNHLSYTDLIVANPQVDLNRLRVGDQINVQKTPLLIRVTVKRKFTVEEPILEHAPPDKAGKRRVTYLVTYINGIEVQRVATAITTLQKPTIHFEIM